MIRRVNSGNDTEIDSREGGIQSLAAKSSSTSCEYVDKQKLSHLLNSRGLKENRNIKKAS